DPGLLGGPVQIGEVLLARPDIDRRNVPGDEASRVEHLVDELLRRDPATGHVASTCPRPSRSTYTGANEWEDMCVFLRHTAYILPLVVGSAIGRALPST